MDSLIQSRLRKLAGPPRIKLPMVKPALGLGAHAPVAKLAPPMAAHAPPLAAHAPPMAKPAPAGATVGSLVPPAPAPATGGQSWKPWAAGAGIIGAAGTAGYLGKNQNPQAWNGKNIPSYYGTGEQTGPAVDQEDQQYNRLFQAAGLVK